MKKRVLCYGDSNTWGFIAGSGNRFPDDVRWTGVCQEKLGLDYKILEDGLNGRTTVYDQEWAQGRNGLKGLPYSLQAQAPLDLCVIMLGTNDLSMMSLPLVRLGIEEVVRQVKESNHLYRTFQPIFPEGPKILLIGPPTYNPAFEEDRNSTIYHKYEDSVRLSEVCREIAEQYDTYYLDARPFCEVSEIDGCHLTEESHHRLGEAVAAKIREIFENKED